VNGRSGVYVQAAQQVWKGVRNPQSLALFGVLTLNDRRTGFFRTTTELGVSWRGIVPGRADDILSASWVGLNVNRRVALTQREGEMPVQTSEQFFEINYGVQATPSVIVRPGLQYVVRPSGYASRPDSLVASIHVGVTL
jgi:porin